MRLVDRQRLEAYLARRDLVATAGITPRGAGAAAAPLSFAQQQVWLHAQLAPDLPLYNEPLTIRRSGPLDAGALERALAEVIRRHQAWRTTFAVRDGEPVQVVHPPFVVSLPIVDLRALPAGEREAAAARLATAEARRPFDLERGPLLRARLVRLDEHEHRLFLTVHHIVLDGVSIYRVLAPELIALYEAFASGVAPTLPAPSVQYADFAAWQRAALTATALAPSLAYWRGRLSGLPALALPTDHPRPAIQSFAGARHRLELPAALGARLRALARREASSVFMVLLAAFQALLHRLTGQDDLALGTVSAGRSRPELERLLGFFANPLPLRGDLTGDPTFAELLVRVRDQTLEALAHDDVPFELLVNELGIERDAGRNPLFQVAFSLEAPRVPLPAGWDVGHLDVDTGTCKFDLYLELDERPETIVGRVVYRTDLFDATTIERLAARYRRVLEAVVADPGRRLSALPVVDEAERAQLLAWGVRRAAYPEDATVHGLFARVAAATPTAVALVDGREELTYRELDRRAERLAGALGRLGVGPDVPVGVCLERSVAAVVAFLAVLKAGGAYVPLEPGYPVERLQLMLLDAHAGVLVTRQALHARLGLPARHAVLVDAAAAPGEPDQRDRPPVAGPDHLAYVMFTSGSSGRPKGVAVPHRAIVRLLFGQTYARFGADRTFLAASAISFDAATFELWGALLHGGRCVLLPAGLPTPAVLGELIRRQRVTTLWLTASLFNAVIDEAPETLAGVEEVLLGGEALSAAHVRRARARLPGVTLVNGYGPTECTTFACCHRLTGPFEPAAHSVPIGPPIANTEAWVLDGRRALTPLGGVGELYLGGPGLARGYLNRPELTAERFVPHPFDPTPGARLYRTGDLVRWRTDGVLDFVGRVDDQVKIRGFRIEPGEVEAALAAHPDVQDTVVLAREREPADRELVAYVVLRRPLTDTSSLAEHLRRRLPTYMIPARLVPIAAVPLTPVGKVDRSALAALETPATAAPRLPARDPLEARLVALWEEILGVHPIGIKDDFFALGGHSLRAVRLVQQIERLFGQRLPPSLLHANATVESLARVLLHRERGQRAVPVLRLQEHGRHRPLFFFHGDLNGGGFYCRELARHLGPEQPVTVIHPLGLDHGQVPGTIEAMAAVHLAQIRSLQPHGPYFIGGYCNGALTAYEVARTLAAAGEAVEPVVLIAAAADRRLRRIRRLVDRIACSLGMQEDEAARYFGRLRYLVDRFAAADLNRKAMLGLGGLATFAGEILARATGARPSPFTRTPIPEDAGAAVRIRDGLLGEETYARYFTAVMAYVPRPFAGRLVVFWPTEQLPRRPEDGTLGWGPLAAHVEVIRVPGDHHTIVTRHTELIARAVQATRGHDTLAVPAE
jgi:aspartate racemase